MKIYVLIVLHKIQNERSVFFHQRDCNSVRHAVQMDYLFVKSQDVSLFGAKRTDNSQ